jgi:BirA family transcriptional regulator, biotin operon repressor / biotin---[acetyl-CoA-carboxylase] ligase
MSVTHSSPWDPLDWRAVARARAGSRVGRHIIYEASVASTNLLARALLRRGAADGTVVVTDDQTQGRGRLGREWIAVPCAGLTFSVCLRPPADRLLHALSPAAALAVGGVVHDVAGARCTLKWPNDVLVDGAKVCGILIELDEMGDHRVAVVGIGLNVNAAPPLASATCLAASSGAPLAREPVLIRLLAALEQYVRAAESTPDVVIGQWRDRLDTLGRHVRVHSTAGVVEGVAVDVDAEGALLVRSHDGTTSPIHAGDIL